MIQHVCPTINVSVIIFIGNFNVLFVINLGYLYRMSLQCPGVVISVLDWYNLLNCDTIMQRIEDNGRNIVTLVETVTVTLLLLLLQAYQVEVMTY